MRVALGISYRGQGYHGWQSQPDGNTVQDKLELALSRFADSPVRCMCAGRTDSGVHALNQVVHFDTSVSRERFSWVRGTNRFLPADIAVQWCLPTDEAFHARFSALGRRYAYVLRESAVRPSVEAGAVGWSFRALDPVSIRAASDLLIGEHDFSAFRSAECQARSPVKTLRSINVHQKGTYWRFEFDANAFLHHMVRNIMGSLLAVGSGTRDLEWFKQVFAFGDRRLAAPTFPPDGLYFLGPYYDATLGVPAESEMIDWLP